MDVCFKNELKEELSVECKYQEFGLDFTKQQQQEYFLNKSERYVTTFLGVSQCIMALAIKAFARSFFPCYVFHLSK